MKAVFYLADSGELDVRATMKVRRAAGRNRLTRPVLEKSRKQILEEGEREVRALVELEAQGHGPAYCDLCLGTCALGGGS